MLNPLNTQIIRGDCHPELPRAHQYHRSETYGGGSMSLEEAQVLCSLVQIIKPHAVFESGTEAGFSAAYMGLGCALNGFGKVYSCDIDAAWVVTARENHQRDGVRDWVDVLNTDSLEFIENTNLSFGFALIDSIISLRLAEITALLPKMEAGGIIATHDTSPLHPLERGANLLQNLRTLGVERDLQVIHLPSPRGLTILQVP